jgi:hypothetical protein
VEGPFLNPDHRGAHDDALMLDPTAERLARWLQCPAPDAEPGSTDCAGPCRRRTNRAGGARRPGPARPRPGRSPIAAVESGFPVLLIEANGPTLRQMRAPGRDLCDRGARLLRLTDRTDGRDPLAVAVTTGLPESLTPLPFAVAGQLLALRRTLDKGLDPDRPRGLQKVTETL